jgi:hypothetical protein
MLNGYSPQTKKLNQKKLYWHSQPDEVEHT